MTYVTCRLTAKNRDQLRNPTLGNRVWATFSFFTGAQQQCRRSTALSSKCEHCCVLICDRQRMEETCLSAGNTALHDCAESGSVDIMKLLLSHGAVMERDSYGLTPLLAAAVAGHARVVDFLSAHCSLAERVDALDLLGATFVDKKRDVASAGKVRPTHIYTTTTI